MRGVITHVSDPYSVTDWTTAKYIWPEVRSPPPSIPITLASHTHSRLDFRRLMTTYDQY